MIKVTENGECQVIGVSCPFCVNLYVPRFFLLGNLSNLLSGKCGTRRGSVNIGTTVSVINLFCPFGDYR